MNNTISANTKATNGICLIIGMIMTAIGFLAFCLEFSASGLVMTASLLTAWAGMALALFNWHSKVRADFPIPESNCSSSAEREWGRKNVILNCLRNFGTSVHSRSVILLEAGDGLWIYKAGWNCSMHAGNMIAEMLFGRVSSDSQDLISLSVMGEDVLAFCTPIHLDSGNSKVLVVLGDMNSAMPHNISYLSSVCSFGLIKVFERSHSSNEESEMQFGFSPNKKSQGALNA